jgi:hypothetical protein
LIVISLKREILWCTVKFYGVQKNAFDTFFNKEIRNESTKIDFSQLPPQQSGQEWKIWDRKSVFYFNHLFSKF